MYISDDWTPYTNYIRLSGSSLQASLHCAVIVRLEFKLSAVTHSAWLLSVMSMFLFLSVAPEESSFFFSHFSDKENETQLNNFSKFT